MSGKHGNRGTVGGDEHSRRGRSGEDAFGRERTNRGGSGTSGKSKRHRGRERNERGQYVEKLPKEGIVALFDRVRGPVIGTSDVATHFDSTTEGARRKLNELCDAGVLERRKVGGTRVYWRAAPPEEQP
ncbi:MAG: hypothetical protein ACOCY6_01635 [Halodesulfurarchaeum sp.]